MSCMEHQGPELTDKLYFQNFCFRRKRKQLAEVHLLLTESGKHIYIEKWVSHLQLHFLIEGYSSFLSSQVAVGVEGKLSNVLALLKWIGSKVVNIHALVGCLWGYRLCSKRWINKSKNREIQFYTYSIWINFFFSSPYPFHTFFNVIDYW